MIDLYFWRTPNSSKVAIFCEEAAVPYRIVPIDIGAGDQLSPSFKKINPNGKVPAIIDPDGPHGRPITIFESGAILIYLAEKIGHFLPSQPEKRYAVLQWLMFQMGGLGPMLGQAHHFRGYAAEKIEYAVERYTHERGISVIRRAGRNVGGLRIHRGRLLDRRHGHRTVDHAL